MGTRAPLIASLCIVAGMVGASLWIWPLIPDNAPVAIHWDLHGLPNGTAPKPVALFLTPAIALLLTLLMAWVSRARGGDTTGYVTGWIAGVLTLAAAHALILLTARHVQLDVMGNSMLIAGLLTLVVGNVLGKTRPNRFVGMRTPWTYRSDYSWEKTNRLCGRLFVAIGLVTLAALVLGGAQPAFAVFIVGVTATAIVAFPLSYYYWRHEPQGDRP